MGVIDMAFLVIVENLVCLLDGLKLNLGLWAFIFGDFVGMAGEGSLNQFAISNYIFK